MDSLREKIVELQKEVEALAQLQEARKTTNEEQPFRLEEVQQDLFELDAKWTLVHCVAADFRLGAGIAVRFKELYGTAGYSGPRQVGKATVLTTDQGRKIFALVTKERSEDKPKFENLVAALRDLFRQVADNKLAFIAMPKLGCGLDGLQWPYVKTSIQLICEGKQNLHIKVCLPRSSHDFGRGVRRRETLRQYNRGASHGGEYRGGRGGFWGGRGGFRGGRGSFDDHRGSFRGGRGSFRGGRGSFRGRWGRY